MGIIIRPYQAEAVERVLQLRNTAKMGVGIESPTGTGKSLMLALWAHRLASEGRRVMILAHREELVTGNAGAVEALTGERCWVELNQRHRMSYADWNELKGNGGIVSASVDTMQGKRLQGMPSDLITDILCDEGHHVRPLTNKSFGYECPKCQGNGTIDKYDSDKKEWSEEDCPKCDGKGELKESGSKYYKVKAHFRDAPWGAVSGTFFRAGQRGKDGKKDNLMTKVFDQVHQTGTLWKFVDEGWLVEPKFDHLAAVSAQLDFSKLKSKHVSEKQAQEVWETHKLAAMNELRHGLFHHCGNRICLIFSPKVQHAVWTSEIIRNADTNEYPTMGPETADYVASYTIEDDGTRGKYHDDRRRGIVERMRAGTLQWCANQGVFTEGTDIPTVAALAMCRQTESDNLMRQMVGRGLRTLKGVLDGLETASNAERLSAIAASAKPDCLVLDMAGVTQDGSVAHLATPTSLIEVPGWSDAQKKMAERYWQVMWEKGKAPGMREAKEEIEHAASAWMQGVRAMMQEVTEKVDWTVTRVDVRNGGNDAVATHYHADNPDRPSDKQINFCAKLCKATKKYDLSKEDILGFDKRTVSKLIADMKPIYDQMPTEGWIRGKLKAMGMACPSTNGAAWALLTGRF